MLAEFDSRHRAEREAFEIEQRAFVRRYPVPSRSDFPGLGTLILNECELLAWPERAFVRARFTYVNTTGSRKEGVLATLLVTDPRTGEAWGESLLMRLPYKYSLTPDSTYTSWIDVPTNGVHTLAGWEWELLLEAPKATPR